MFKLIWDNFRIIRDFFRLMHGNRKWVFLLFLGVSLAHIGTLISPIFASNIIYEVTVRNADATYLNIALLCVTEVFSFLARYLSNISYSHNFPYVYRNLRERVIDKIFTYDVFVRLSQENEGNPSRELPSFLPRDYLRRFSVFTMAR